MALTVVHVPYSLDSGEDAFAPPTDASVHYLLVQRGGCPAVDNGPFLQSELACT